MACGIGRHAVSFARAGHAVTAVDLSETFLDKGRALAAEAGVQVEFLCQDLRSLAFKDTFDVVTWIERSMWEQATLRSIHDSLKVGGRFIFDVRNPDHPRAKHRGGNWRTWTERDGVFELERHETDEATGLHEDVWITIDTINETIVEKGAAGPAMSLEETLDLARRAGFSEVELRTMEGPLFAGGEEPYWLWAVANK